MSALLLGYFDVDPSQSILLVIAQFNSLKKGDIHLIQLYFLKSSCPTIVIKASSTVNEKK